MCGLGSYAPKEWAARPKRMVVVAAAPSMGLRFLSFGNQVLATLTLRLPTDDMPGRDYLSKLRERSVDHLRFVKKLHDERQVDCHAQKVGGMHDALGTKAGDAPKYGNPMDLVLVMQQRKDLLH